jgi:hypothetical protein
MIIDSLCPPAVLYLGFSIIQIIIDLFRGQQNSAFLKMGGLTILSWFIVFIPFIMMTYVTTILLYVFGLNPSKGKQQQSQPDPRSVHHPAVPLPYNSQEIGGCSRTQFGCCPNGLTASNEYGSNCQWPQPYTRHGGHHHFLPTARPTTRPSAGPSPSPSATTRPSAIPSPSPTATVSPSPSPSPTVTTMPSASPTPTTMPSITPSPTRS